MNSNDLFIKSVKYLEKELEKMIPYQVLDSDSPDYGGLFAESIYFCAGTHYENAKFIQYLGYAYCSKESKYFGSEEIFKRILLAIKFEETLVRASGFIDLRSRNYDSPPDTAFALNVVAEVIYMARNLADVPRSKELEEALKPFVISSCKVIADHGGFHTPNHRWIIAGALSLGYELYPELDIKNAIYEYLNETIDLNKDGLYSEKSFLYSAHINDKLMNVYHAFNEQSIVESIHKNCNCIIVLMNNDATLLTSISIRQDNGQRLIPKDFLSCFYFAAKKYSDNRIWAALKKIIDIGGVQSIGLIYLFARYPQWKNDEINIPALYENGAVHLKDSGIWGYKNDDLSVWIAENKQSAVSMQFGDVAISEIILETSWFTGTKYIAKNLNPVDYGVEFDLIPTYSGEQSVHMPGYWKPLGRTVTFDDLPYNNLTERSPTHVPDISYKWKIKVNKDGIDIHVTSIGGLDKVAVSLEFVFDLPGVFYTDQIFEDVDKERLVVLTDGYATYRRGIYGVTIGEGSFKHSIYNKAPKDKFKVVITDKTPIDKVFSVKCHHMNGKDCEAYKKVIK